ncbi:MAG: ABC transporter ATP-binding protein [Alphaproteobacteria bacterium]
MSELSIKSVTSGYGGVQIINGVSMQVDQGEIVAVIGRNGVGKTTLMKTIIGDVTTASGTLALGDFDITRLRPSRRAQLGIGYVPQGRGIFSQMTVGANLALGQNVGSAAVAHLERAFTYFPVLKKRQLQLAGSMSGGEQQQLAIARILVGNPRIILLDEPSEGIQPNIVQEIGRTIRRLRDEEGLTVVIVEQNLNLIQASADRCVVLDRGTVVAEIAPEELSNPETAKRHLAI